jgi:hypothetical protein
MTVVAMVSADKPIIRICDLDQDEESADIVFATQADADARWRCNRRPEPCRSCS